MVPSAKLINIHLVVQAREESGKTSWNSQKIPSPGRRASFTVTSNNNQNCSLEGPSVDRCFAENKTILFLQLTPKFMCCQGYRWASSG